MRCSFYGNQWHDSIIYNHPNANGKSELDSDETQAGQCSESGLNLPSCFDKNSEVNKDE